MFNKLKGRKLSAAIVIFFLAIGSTLILNSCGGGGGSSSGATPPYIVAALVSVGTPISNFKTGMVTVKNGSGGSDITNATVTMNGVPFVYNPAIGHTAYEGNVNVASQGTVTVSVTIGNATYTASGTQYTSYPSITEPQSGATWSSIVPNTIQWSGGAPSTNSAYAFAILNAADPNGQLVWPADNNIYVVPLSTTSYSIPPLGSLNTGNCIVLVGIVKIVPIPNTTSDSGLVIGGYNSVPITVN